MRPRKVRSDPAARDASAAAHETPRRHDPPTTEFNPLDYDNLTRNVVTELMTRGPFTLPLSDPFDGAGVYALFYTGAHELYAPIRSRDARWPIYVGKAVPSGARKGKIEARKTIGRELFGRVREHAGSIEQVADLELADFLCRYLVVTPLWIVMAERFLIEHYQPVWNVGIDGFGIHDPGGRRADQYRSKWDTLHAGRSWAKRLQSHYKPSDVGSEVRAYLAKRRPGQRLPPLPEGVVDRAVGRDE